MKKLIIAILILVFAAASCTASADFLELYPLTTVVVELDYENDIVTIQDFNGFLWEFEGCEDWCENDICSVIMNNNGTKETIFDDIIVTVKYDGWFEGWIY